MNSKDSKEEHHSSVGFQDSSIPHSLTIENEEIAIAGSIKPAPRPLHLALQQISHHFLNYAEPEASIIKVDIAVDERVKGDTRFRNSVISEVPSEQERGKTESLSGTDQERILSLSVPR